MRHWARAIYLPPVPAKHTPASGASPLKQDNIIYLITHPKEKGYRYEDTKQKKKKDTSLMLRYYLLLIFQRDHVSSQGVFNIYSWNKLQKAILYQIPPLTI